jgi:hypothetical protein
MEDTLETKFEVQKMIFVTTIHANRGLKVPSGMICKVEKAENCWSRLEVDSGTIPWAEGVEIVASLPHEKLDWSEEGMVW